MTFLQHKKQNYFRYSVLAVFSAAVIMLAVIFLKVKGAETLVFKLFSKANFLRPLAIGQNNQESVLLLAKISDLEKENQLLRESVGLGGTQGEIPAKVVLGGGYIFSEALYINEGSGSEIHAGDIVLSPEKIFVGKISEVGRDWSKIKPFGALGEKIVLRFGPNKEIAVFATGLGRGELSAELPKDTQIMPGETVWLGEKPEYAAGLISEAGKVDGGEIQNIIIKSQLPFGSLLNIVILKSR
ncbi:hypothetical protein A2W54_03835 [Candidatus Giovannonibacteria bacterium RIFCSPHIGHO2_02_43_13]|uniref:Rod shape-determining protein MreC beta-barrel core domain-containing protein n=1 Tax=Candidatus Giovannonibacteria bacterium RIFCSPHIGHO2_02_43_13 TaxID=1798330 RepID=A0A1F5WRB2_9BACT|nr:MAG: hypothetical protein UW28_C0013G0025 [Parcubacteria group bacterium GW2011_GWA2_44_13]OGF74651.1 MAG: hypothetical protein A3E06_02945 [Candidatus Giovannonibacteria bacterium RIFCSPHIGHO2_12_FULL_44_42]OGF78206.1 MAG: hypothetical protein A2W54_03835 [Candidatus Giovannonibacteria bacterium RIFCSPHIGHO2_02_43_13]OGF90072.1 MAG: hypothetical protein A3I94_03050 [Candidatus Giovannonibacteria bacterium RIFCSPLOWO2_02_FULL_43_54]OGF96613.1 MAG: hypothetical protein A3H08_01590 [Candidatus